MTRGMLDDDLLVHEFHLLDVDWSLSAFPFVLFPTVGFSSITSPEYSIEAEDIREGTSDFVHKVLGKTNTNTITLQKGVTPFNSDFWRWTVACLKGRPPSSSLGASLAAALGGASTVSGKRRNMMLLHLTGISLEGLKESMSNSPKDALRGAALLPAAGITGIAEGLATLTGGMIDVGISSIPGKVYMMFDCLPVRYKPGSDFDASATDVSIEELEFCFSRFEEFSIAG